MVGEDPGGVAEQGGGRRAGAMALSLLAAAAVVVWQNAGRTPLDARADAGADSTLFSLTNQDRASNGLRALQWHATLGAIGENKYYGGCGFAVYGRSDDMIVRNYFAHPILNCGGQLVFNMMNANGIGYRSAGENIGWSSGAGDGNASAAYINTAFMNSPEHRANILNGNYTHMGTGSWFGASWSGSGQQSNVWMFSEEFAQLSAPPPPPPPPPPPRTAPPPAPATSAPVARNEPAPTPALPAPQTTAAPQAATPAPTPLPTAEGAVPGVQPPLLEMPGGLLSDAVLSVLEGYLLD